MAAPEQTPYPPADALDRAILVTDISSAATPSDIEDFFSFCGTVESHKFRTVSATNGKQQMQEAVVIFADASARADALVMDKSSIVDHPVSIAPIPDGYDFHAPLAAPSKQNGFFAGGFAAFGDLFAGVGTAVAAEVDKAGKMLDSATETGVLKSARDQVALASQKTRDFASDIDQKWQVRDNLANAAATSRDRASQVASAVATQTMNAAQQVDKSLHISENTEMLAGKARENQAVNSGITAVTGGFQQLLVQTGLGPNESATPSAPQQPSESSPPSQTSTAPEQQK